MVWWSGEAIGARPDGNQQVPALRTIGYIADEFWRTFVPERGETPAQEAVDKGRVYTAAAAIIAIVHLRSVHSTKTT